MANSKFFFSQPFRGNPDYDTVADLPFDTHCLEKLTRNQEEIHIKSITKCRMETMYRSSCMADMLSSAGNETKAQRYIKSPADNHSIYQKFKMQGKLMM